MLRPEWQSQATRRRASAPRDNRPAAARRPPPPSRRREIRSWCARPRQYQRGANRLGDALQADQKREQRNERLEQIDQRQAAGLARAFKDRPGPFDVRYRQRGNRDRERKQKDDGS